MLSLTALSLVDKLIVRRNSHEEKHAIPVFGSSHGSAITVSNKWRYVFEELEMTISPLTRREG